MAQRILGMGDILAVIEKAEESFDMEQAEKLEKQMKKKELYLDAYKKWENKCIDVEV